MGRCAYGWLLTHKVLLRVEEIENKIGAGLIEEVVQMAESELKLIDIMYEAKVYVLQPHMGTYVQS